MFRASSGFSQFWMATSAIRGIIREPRRNTRDTAAAGRRSAATAASSSCSRTGSSISIVTTASSSSRMVRPIGSSQYHREVGKLYERGRLKLDNTMEIGTKKERSNENRKYRFINLFKSIFLQDKGKQKLTFIIFIEKIFLFDKRKR